MPAAHELPQLLLLPSSVINTPRRGQAFWEGSWEEVTRGHGRCEQVLPASPCAVTVLGQAVAPQPRGPTGS